MIEGQRGSAKHGLEERDVDEQGGEGDLYRNAAEECSIAEQPDGTQGGVFGSGDKGGADLAGDDAHPGNGGGLLVSLMQGSAWSGGCAGVPPGAMQDDEESTHDQRGGDSTEESPSAGHKCSVDDAFGAGAGRAVHQTRFGGLTAKRQCGHDVGAQVDRQDL